MSKYRKEDIFRIVEEEDVEFIRLQFTDIFGMLKNVAITSSQLKKALDNRCMFDGSSIEGFVRIEESDMYLYPDLDTFEIFPWRPQQGKVARLMCDVYRPDKTPFEGDPRYVLRRVLKEASDMGFVFNAGPECEFFIFQTDEEGRPTTETHEIAGYFDVAPIDQGENVRRDIVLNLEDMGFMIEASHHEMAPGQHEIDFEYAEGLVTADNVMTFKMAVKAIAKRHGLHATFMPKPKAGVNGSGMHLNMSLSGLNGKNLFEDETDQLGLSRIAYIAWSAKANRSPLIRIPSSRGESTRIELRCPDPSVNPYLALAACLAAGLDGIKKGMVPPDSVDTNIYTMAPEEVRARGISRLPETLGEAIEEFKSSEFMKEVLGEHIYTKYLEAKEAEWRMFRAYVTDWETKEYLYKY